MQHIGKRIAEIRRRLEVNQIEFAKHYNVSQSALKNYERGAAEPPARLLAAICLEQNISADWLLLGTGFVDKRNQKMGRTRATKTVSEFLERKELDLPLQSVLELIELIEEYYHSHDEPREQLEQNILEQFARGAA